ncbi:hypothetical protein [Burkholderia pyrrocinia]|uniref:hypothetical protein n=1 Tax=Burkholderia pyrrocinia TaxID=60550 RepID=UPI00158C2CE0|nr:hypothetical protein [Burkholderia pyrrocinia]
MTAAEDRLNRLPQAFCPFKLFLCSNDLEYERTHLVPLGIAALHRAQYAVSPGSVTPAPTDPK